MLPIPSLSRFASSLIYMPVLVSIFARPAVSASGAATIAMFIFENLINIFDNPHHYARRLVADVDIPLEQRGLGNRTNG